MDKHLNELARTYRQAGDAIHDAIRDDILKVGGFLNCSNNDQEKKDMEALVYASDTGYTQSFPIRAIKVTDTGVVWVYAGSYGTFYTDKYLRSPRSDGHWIRLKDSNILYYQTILSIAAAIDEYLP